MFRTAFSFFETSRVHLRPVTVLNSLVPIGSIVLVLT